MPENRGIDVGELMAWWEHLEEYAIWFFETIQYARFHLLVHGNLSPEAKIFVRELICLLEDVRAALLLKRVRVRLDARIDELFQHQKRCRDVGLWSIVALAGYAGDVELLKTPARKLLHDGEKWPALTQALVENRLQAIAENRVHWRDWRHANNPRAWIKTVACTIAAKDAKKDARRSGMVSLNDIVGTQYESAEADTVAVGVIPESALTALIAAAQADPDVSVYVGLRAKGLKHKAIAAQLGWTKRHANNVQQRFLNYRKKLHDMGVGAVEYRPIADASKTVFFETLDDGNRGRKFGTWTHKRQEGK